MIKLKHNPMKSLVVLILFFPLLANAQLQFEDQATTLNAGYEYGDGFLGGGISFYDYDNDGWDDITMSTETGSGIIFLRNSQGTFQQEFPTIVDGSLQTKQLVWVDYDNDGDNDLFAASDEGLSKLFKNQGNQVFTDITATSGLPLVPYETFGGAWGDYNNDGLLDVFITIRDPAQTQPNLLFRNNGDDTFTDVTVSAGLETDGYLSFCAAWFDYNNDGLQDIYMANDKYVTENILYKNKGDGTFENVSEVTGTNLIMGAMSTTIDDYNHDGWLDIYITNDNKVLPDTTTGNAFLRNNGDGTFTNIAVENGTQFNSIGWGAVFLDADNDRDHDLYVSGLITEQGGMLPSAFYENDGTGSYSIPQNIGFENDTRQSFSNAIGDVDNDGFPEIAVLNDGNENIFLWKNLTSNNNNWLKVKLEGIQSNRMGIGSWIELGADGHVQYHYTLCGEGYLGQNSSYEFFGLADAAFVDYVKVTWLSGAVDYIEDIGVNQAITVVEGSSPLAVSEVQKNAFTIYPNPARDHFYLRVPHLTEETIKLKIYNVLGNLLRTESIRYKVHRFDISKLPAGVYLVSLEGENSRETRKLVIR